MSILTEQTIDFISYSYKKVFDNGVDLERIVFWWVIPIVLYWIFGRYFCYKDDKEFIKIPRFLIWFFGRSSITKKESHLISQLGFSLQIGAYLLALFPFACPSFYFYEGILSNPFVSPLLCLGVGGSLTDIVKKVSSYTISNEDYIQQN